MVIFRQMKGNLRRTKAFARRTEAFARRTEAFARRTKAFARRAKGLSSREMASARRAKGLSRREMASARREMGISPRKMAIYLREMGISRAGNHNIFWASPEEGPSYCVFSQQLTELALVPTLQLWNERNRASERGNSGPAPRAHSASGAAAVRKRARHHRRFSPSCRSSCFGTHLSAKLCFDGRPRRHPSRPRFDEAELRRQSALPSRSLGARKERFLQLTGPGRRSLLRHIPRLCRAAAAYASAKHSPCQRTPPALQCANAALHSDVYAADARLNLDVRRRRTSLIK